MQRGFKLGYLKESSEIRSKALKGKNIWTSKQLWITNGYIEKLIKSENKEEFLNNNFKLGRLKNSEETIIKKSNNQKNKRWVRNDKEEKLVNLVEYETYLLNGYIKGRFAMREDTKKKKSIITHTKRWVNDEITNFYINESLVPEFINKGYKLGMIHKDKNK